MVIIKNFVPQDNGNPTLERVEMLLGQNEVPPENPQVAPGSIAYTADLTFVAMYDGTRWVTIKGGA